MCVVDFYKLSSAFACLSLRSHQIAGLVGLLVMVLLFGLLSWWIALPRYENLSQLEWLLVQSTGNGETKDLGALLWLTVNNLDDKIN